MGLSTNDFMRYMVIILIVLTSVIVISGLVIVMVEMAQAYLQPTNWVEIK